MNPASIADDQFLTTAEVARRIGLKPNTLAVWRKRRQPGSPSFVKMCGAVRYRASTIEAWLQDNEKGAAE